jgi:hypothetical protein
MCMVSDGFSPHRHVLSIQVSATYLLYNTTVCCHLRQGVLCYVMFVHRICDMYRKIVMLCIELHGNYMGSHRGLGWRGRVVLLPRVAESKGWKNEWKNEYFNYNLIFCGTFEPNKNKLDKLPYLFKASNFCKVRPLWFFASGVKKPCYISGSHICILWDLI